LGKRQLEIAKKALSEQNQNKNNSKTIDFTRFFIEKSA
jgi:hypothetical protein